MKRYFAIHVAIIIFIVFLLRKFHFKKNLPKMKTLFDFKTKYSGDIDKDIISFVQEKEGGLSKDKNDSASSGRKIGGYHTNKGVTADTFFNLSSKLGYVANERNFINMPDNIWLKIFFNEYVKPFQNASNYRVLNYALGVWAWGSGVAGATRLFGDFLHKKNISDLNKLVNYQGVEKTLEDMVNFRKSYYDRIVESKPKNDKFLKGWKNAQSNFFNIFKNYNG